MKYLVFDYETRSEANLKKVGAFEYSCHPTTEILCVAWRFGTKEELKTGETKTWSPRKPSPYGEFIRALSDPSVTLIAHNAFFEQVITRNVLTRIIDRVGLDSIPPSRFICTASLAAALALPRSLDGVTQALRLTHKKDNEGHRLMLKMSKPRKPTKNNPAKWHESEADIDRLIQYCARDINAEVELFLKLPPLHPTERAIWKLDQEMNFRGFEVDRPLIKKVLGLIETNVTRLNEETLALTNGAIESATRRDALLKWVNAMGAGLPDLTSKTVANAILGAALAPKARRLLEIRQAVSKTSTAKYEAMEMRSRHDGRVRDNVVYHSASTGRWGGAGVQPHNFPRGSLKDSIEAVDVLNLENLDLIELVYGDPMRVFSSCLRPMIQAAQGHQFYCADFSAIEARVVFWLADHEAGLSSFREDRPIYEEMAAVIYDKSVAQIISDERQLGKKAILGCGFGMGKKKFFETCKADGMEVSEDLAERAVEAYRTAHRPVVRLWSNLERAAIFAVKNPGKRVKINHTAWWVSGKFLYCELPSGRRLAYYGPELRPVTTSWGEKRLALHHWGVDSMSKKWVRSGTYGGKLTENVTQAVARDCMAAAMLRLEEKGYRIVLTVHDEILSEVLRTFGSLDEFKNIMAQTPAWAPGLPIKVSGWAGSRYRK